MAVKLLSQSLWITSLSIGYAPAGTFLWWKLYLKTIEKMSLILVSNTADHSAAQQIRAREQILHNFRGWCVNKHSIFLSSSQPSYRTSMELCRRGRSYWRSSSVTFCYKGRKFAFADTHHYAQAEISKTPLTQFTRGIRGSMIGRWHCRLVLLGRCAHTSKRNLPHTAGLGNALQYRLYS